MKKRIRLFTVFVLMITLRNPAFGSGVWTSESGRHQPSDLFAQEALAAPLGLVRHDLPENHAAVSMRRGTIKILSWWSPEEIAQSHARIARETGDPLKNITGVAQFTPSRTHLQQHTLRQVADMAGERNILKASPRILLVGPADLQEILAAVEAFRPSVLKIQTAAVRSKAEDVLLRPLSEWLSRNPLIQTEFQFFGGTILAPDSTLFDPGVTSPLDIVLMSMVLDVNTPYFSHLMVRHALEVIDQMMSSDGLFVTQGRQQAWPDSPLWWRGLRTQSVFRLIYRAYNEENNFLRVSMKAA